MKVEFFVPEIRGKGRPRFTRNGHAFTDEKTRNYENLVKLLAMQAMKDAGAEVTDKPFSKMMLKSIQLLQQRAISQI